MRKFLKLLASIIIAELAGIIGSIFTTPSIPVWYASLSKPGFAPPNWIFGPVWITLFALMGIASFLVANKGLLNKEVRDSIWVYAVQLLLNTLWSFIFFGLRSPGAAFIEIIILWIAILATIISFWKSSKVAAILLVPYIAWVSFATVLNYYIWILN